MAPVRVRKETKAPAKKQTKTYTAEMYVEQATIALNNCQPDLAAKMFERALSMSPNDTKIMDSLAIICVQMGGDENSKMALELLLKSTALAPDEDWYKWCYLAQLQCPAEAVTCYRTVIQLLTAMLAKSSQKQSGAVQTQGEAAMSPGEISRQIAKAHCSIVELYLSDLCDEPDAEALCEAEVAAAFAACPESTLDAQQTLASLRLSQNYRDDRNYKLEAGEIMKNVCTEILRVRRIIASRTMINDMVEAPLPAECQDAPEMEFCIATMKIAIECATEPAHTDLYLLAQELGQSLLDEDDEDVELRYVLGIAYMGGMDSGCSSNDTTTTAGGKGGKKGVKKAAASASASASASNNTSAGANASATAAAIAEVADLEAAEEQFLEALALLDGIREEATANKTTLDAKFDEQYGLLQEHLRILAVIADAHPELQLQSAGHNARAGNSASTGGSAMQQTGPVDEEWSDDDEGMDVEH